MKITIRRYQPSNANDWNAFLDKTKNSHFMIHRDFMDYHQDRFNDHSLLFLDENENLLAIFPANSSESHLYSHQGLSFGGFLIEPKTRIAELEQMFELLLTYCQQNRMQFLTYKKIPYIYNKYPADEDLYFLFRHQFELVRRDVASAIDLMNPFRYSKGRKYNLSVAKKHDLTIVENNNFSIFWPILENVLMANHECKPTHTLTEIQLLHNRFPNNIKLFEAYLDKNCLGGVVMFLTEQVAHVQYIANSERGREMGAIDFILDFLIKQKYATWRYFDFGISTEENGQVLNKGLIEQKEGFGARAICHDFYRKIL